MDCVRVGVVGMGIGRANARALAANPRGRVVALCDLLEERMAEVAAELPGEQRRFTDFAAMCADPEVDAVMVGSPNQLHVPMAETALRAGKHVLVTKPLADSLEAAESVVALAEGTDRVAMMSLSMRFSGAVQYLGRMTTAGDLGELYYARARSVRRSGIPHWGAHFIRKGGGAFRDMGVHVLDAAWWLIGRPRPVSALGVAGARFGPRGQGYSRPVGEDYWRQYAADDYGCGVIRFENGAGIQVESHWASHQPGGVNIELFGDEGGALLKPLTLYRNLNGRPSDVSVKPPDIGGFDGVAAHFLACILDGEPCQAPLRDGMTVQRMLEAVLTSAETGGEVRL